MTLHLSGFEMGKLTGTKYGDAANELLGFYKDRATALEKAGEYFMSAIALAFATETAILAYLLVEFGEDNGGELEIPDSVNFAELISAANEMDVLAAPMTSHRTLETTTLRQSMSPGRWWIRSGDFAI